MTTAEILQAVSILVPIVGIVVGDGIRTRMRLAVISERVEAQRRDHDELSRRQARHERDPAHARMRGR